VGDGSHVVSGQKFPGERNQCEAVHYNDATASFSLARVRGEVLAHFHVVAVTHHSIRQNCLICQDEFFVNNPLYVKENDEHALDFALHLYTIFRLGEFGFFVYCSCFLHQTFV
jgi:hypothetical protein